MLYVSSYFSTSRSSSCRFTINKQSLTAAQRFVLRSFSFPTVSFSFSFSLLIHFHVWCDWDGQELLKVSNVKQILLVFLCFHSIRFIALFLYFLGYSLFDSKFHRILLFILCFLFFWGGGGILKLCELLVVFVVFCLCIFRPQTS